MKLSAHRHRLAAAEASDAGAVTVRPHLNLAAGALVLAIVAFAVSGALGDLHGTVNQKIIVGCAGGVFVIAAVVATRAAATEVYEVVGSRAGPRHAGVLRWLVTIVGYVIVLITALGLFAVPVQHLVLGGALTGVIVGIAAQQALGNVFAGVVLLLARPFSVGDAIRIKSGSLGGVTEGTVSAMGMTYVTVITEEGPLSVPNSGLLAAAVGPMPGTAYSRSRRFDLSGTETGAALGRPGSGVLRLGRVVGRPPHRLAADAVARRSWRGVVPLQRRSGGQPWNAVRSARARRMNQRSASAGQSASATA